MLTSHSSHTAAAAESRVQIWSQWNQTCSHEEKSGVFPIMHCVLWREEKHVQLLYDLILMLHTQMDIYERKMERRQTVISLWSWAGNFTPQHSEAVRAVSLWNESNWLWWTFVENLQSSMWHVEACQWYGQGWAKGLHGFRVGKYRMICWSDLIMSMLCVLSLNS